MSVSGAGSRQDQESYKGKKCAGGNCPLGGRWPWLRLYGSFASFSSHRTLNCIKRGCLPPSGGAR